MMRFRAIISACHDEAIETLKTHRAKLDAIADALMERETLDEAEVYAVAGIARPAPNHGGEDEVLMPEPLGES